MNFIKHGQFVHKICVILGQFLNFECSLKPRLIIFGFDENIVDARWCWWCCRWWYCWKKLYFVGKKVENVENSLQRSLWYLKFYGTSLIQRFRITVCSSLSCTVCLISLVMTVWRFPLCKDHTLLLVLQNDKLCS